MSTIPKDDFHDLLLDLISLARDYDTSTESKLIEIEELYQLATDGRESWQLCPKCNGDGNLARYNSPGLSTTTHPICDVCHGAKILATPNFGREELEKELLKYKNIALGNLPETTRLITDREARITALQSSLKEKEKECERWKEMMNKAIAASVNFEHINSEQSKKIEELKAENERLIMLTKQLLSK